MTEEIVTKVRVYRTPDTVQFTVGTPDYSDAIVGGPTSVDVLPYIDESIKAVRTAGMDESHYEDLPQIPISETGSVVGEAEYYATVATVYIDPETEESDAELTDDAIRRRKTANR